MPKIIKDGRIYGAAPSTLADLSDTTVSSPTAGQALVYNNSTQKWVNGTVSTVGGLNDLNDVTLENVTNKQELVYDATDDVFKNKTTRVELTQAEYDALANPLPDVDYYITDAPSMSGSSKDLSYDGGTDSTYDVIEEVKGDVADNASDITALQTDKADKSALTWTLLGETTGTAEQSLPANWNELQVYGMFGGNAQYGFVAHAIKAHLGSNPSRYIQGGADKEGGTDHHIAIWHIENGKIGLNFWRYNNTDYTSTAKLIVYYR